MKSPVCEMLGIEFPLFAFSHCRDVVAAVSRAGGFGVLGATGHTAASVHTELKWIDDHVDGKPYGIDLLFPENMATAGEVGVTYNSLKTRIPQEHQDFAAGLELLHRIGADRVMWSSDYPHQESTFGYSRSAIQAVFDATTVENAQKILGKTALDLFDMR